MKKLIVKKYSKIKGTWRVQNKKEECLELVVKINFFTKIENVIYENIFK